MIDKPTIIEFKTDQIVCLEGDNLSLFAEVIDNIAISSRCWVRPLAIFQKQSHADDTANFQSFELEFLHDLRDAAQLILPAVLFRYALDTEVLPLISVLFHPDKDAVLTLDARQALHQFIADIYRQDQD